MFAIKGNKMYITKGDDATITVALTEFTGTAHTFKSGDVVTLTIRDKVGGDVIQTFTATATGETSELSLDITHDKTSAIDVGQYSADVQYTEAATGKIYTIFPVFGEGIDTRRMNGIEENWKNFWVTPEITT